jgi:hypothetical protein
MQSIFSKIANAHLKVFCKNTLCGPAGGYAKNTLSLATEARNCKKFFAMSKRALGKKYPNEDSTSGTLQTHF